MQASDFKVDRLKSGEQVMPFLAEKMPDIILMDVQLPKVDGVTLTRQIRQSSEVPIIMVTSKTDEVSRLLGLQTGGDDYVCKPFSAPS
ncbi:response regulator [Marinifaba aquimaris]|uniref:response regulator n=1 Tax=Marinifaba aquimaris TaxID=2741323 RepID=UPI0031B632C9